MNLKQPRLRAQVACAIAALGTSALLTRRRARSPCRCVRRTGASIEARLTHLFFGSITALSIRRGYRRALHDLFGRRTAWLHGRGLLF